MTLDEKFGTNIDTPHKEKYETYVNAIGLDKTVSFLPYGMTKDVIKREVDKGNVHLNGRIKTADGSFVTLNNWDRSAGFATYGANCTRIGSPLLDSLAKLGVTTVSCAECVCILKRAALMSIGE